MASKTSKIALRIAVLVLVLFLLFFFGRPLYWKISATFHDIRHDNQTVTQGIYYIITIPIPSHALVFYFLYIYVPTFFLPQLFSFFHLPFFFFFFWRVAPLSGLSQIVVDTRKTVGWYHDDSAVRPTNRKLLRYQDLWRVVA